MVSMSRASRTYKPLLSRLSVRFYKGFRIRILINPILTSILTNLKEALRDYI